MKLHKKPGRTEDAPAAPCIVSEVIHDRISDRHLIAHLLRRIGVDPEQASALAAELESDASFLGELRPVLEAAISASFSVSASIQVFDRDGNDITVR